MNRAKSLILAILLVLFAVADVSAQTCVSAPNCAAMGYTKREEDCDGKHILRCFYDTSKVFCGGETTTCPATVTCTETACKTECGGNCVECEACPATVENCAHCTKTCGGNCVECDACEYASTTKPSNCTTADSCSFGGTAYYSNICSECTSPYIGNASGQCVCPATKSCAHCNKTCGGKCIECSTCTYTSTSKPSNCLTASGQCTFSGKTYYSSTCSACAEGYELNSSGKCVCPATQECARCAKYCGGNCIECHSCLYAKTYLPANCMLAPYCVYDGQTYYGAKCTICNNNYELDSTGTCVCKSEEWCPYCNSCHGNCCAGYTATITCDASQGYIKSSCPKDSNLFECVFDTGTYCVALGYDNTVTACEDSYQLTPCPNNSAYKKCVYSTQKACAAEGYDETSCDPSQFPKYCAEDNTYMMCRSARAYCQEKEYTKSSCGAAEDAEPCPEYAALLKCTVNPDKQACVDAGYDKTSCDDYFPYSDQCPYFESLFECLTIDAKCKKEGYEKPSCVSVTASNNISKLICPYGTSVYGRCHTHDESITCSAGYIKIYPLPSLTTTCSGASVEFDAESGKICTIDAPYCGNYVCHKLKGNWLKGRISILYETYEACTLKSSYYYPKFRGRYHCNVDGQYYRDGENDVNVVWRPFWELGAVKANISTTEEGDSISGPFCSYGVNEHGLGKTTQEKCETVALSLVGTYYTWGPSDPYYSCYVLLP